MEKRVGLIGTIEIFEAGFFNIPLSNKPAEFSLPILHLS